MWKLLFDCYFNLNNSSLPALSILFCHEVTKKKLRVLRDFVVIIII